MTVTSGRVPESVDLIVKSGRANLNLRNAKGFNILQVAVVAGNLGFVLFILKYQE